MKNILQALFILLCLLLPGFSWAANWHPFPFKASFYSRPVLIPALHSSGSSQPEAPNFKGKAVEGFYFDSSYTQSGQAVKMRSGQYGPKPAHTGRLVTGFHYWPYQLLTNADSSSVTFRYYELGDMSSIKEIIFYPKRQGIGMFTPNRVKSVQNIFGQSDSVVQFTDNAGLPVVWSKNFGLVQFEDLTLLGIKDLSLGWKPMEGKPVLPKTGDVMHYRQIEKTNTTQGTGGICPNVGSTSIAKEYRIKVLNYPYQSDSTKIEYEVIESNEGDTTGILYSKVWYIDLSSDIIMKLPGTFSGPDFWPQSSSTLIDSLGCVLPTTSTIVIDAGEQFKFTPCINFHPAEFGGGEGYSNWFCISSFLNLTIPVYINAQNGCQTGVALPAVTITSTKETASSSKISIRPNPAQGKIWITGLRTESAFTLQNALGKTMEVEMARDQSLDVSRLPAGIYFLKYNKGVERIVIH